MKHLDDQQLVFHHYQEDDDRQSVEAHLADCEACRARYHALRDMLSAITPLPVPERSADYGHEVWQRLSRRLEERPWSFWRRRLAWPGLPGFPGGWFAPAMAAVVLAAFLGGMFWPRPLSRDTLAGQLRQELRRELAADFERALDRSRADAANALAALEARVAQDAKAQARQLVQALTEVLKRAGAEDRQALLTLFGDWAEQNASAYAELRQELEALASLTDQEVRRTRSQFIALAAQAREQPFDINK